MIVKYGGNKDGKETENNHSDPQLWQYNGNKPSVFGQFKVRSTTSSAASERALDTLRPGDAMCITIVSKSFW